MAHDILPTSVVGSYPQPNWLIDRDALLHGTPARVRSEGLWRIPADFLAQAQDDATILAVRDMQRAGVDIITDGENRRESYSNRFATALGGLDLDNPGEIVGRAGKPYAVPRVVGPIKRERAVEVGDIEFLRGLTDQTIMMTVPGPFTMTHQAQDDFYGDEEALALDYAAAVNEEVRDLFAAGADVVCIDEPWIQTHAEQARRYAVKAINRALEGIEGTTALHMCFGYAAMVKAREGVYNFLAELEDTSVQRISIEAAQPNLDLSILDRMPTKTIALGVLDLNDMTVETPQVVAERIRKGLEHLAPERLIAAPDCGMKYLPRDVAFGKLQALTAGADIVRRELAG